MGHEYIIEGLDAEDIPISQSKIVEIVEVYMFLTVLLVSIFWIAIFFLCLCIFRRKKQQSQA